MKLTSLKSFVFNADECGTKYKCDQMGDNYWYGCWCNKHRKMYQVTEFHDGTWQRGAMKHVVEKLIELLEEFLTVPPMGVDLIEKSIDD